MRFDIDLEFSTTLPADGDHEATVVRGRIEASGREIHVHTDSAALFRLGSRRQLPALRVAAEALAQRGITVRISVPEGTIASIGAVEVSAIQKIITRSPHIKLGKASTWATVVKAQGPGRDSASLMPPSTPLPLSPTFQRRYRMRPTTTHYARGGGRPRLIFVRDSATWDGLPPHEYNLTLETTVLGSGDEAHFKLPDLAAIHGKILHTDQDEYVFVPHGDVPKGSEARILRTGARIILGPWRLVFFREEYADHGRPFGGRTAGEFAHLQRPQFDPRTGQIEYDAIGGLGDSRRPK
ncbi:FHA domain-containing protein [Arthrobacter sp. N199823]|uniref:FHA domain-containing protein n=1 Tax=Arthrobacter sp. N199823 TaxID=2058895 RepID=UPI00215712D9|nr:FHA domain-containing protein [Arthrobacter sp. N199823]